MTHLQETGTGFLLPVSGLCVMGLTSHYDVSRGQTSTMTAEHVQPLAARKDIPDNDDQALAAVHYKKTHPPTTNGRLSSETAAVARHYIIFVDFMKTF